MKLYSTPRNLWHQGTGLALFTAALAFTPATARAQNREMGETSRAEAFAPANASSPLEISLAFLFFGLQDDTLVVRKRYRVENPTGLTITPDRTTLRFYIPSEGAGEVGAKITTGNTSRSITLQPTQEAEGYRIDSAIPPGRATLDVEYRLPFQPGGQLHEERFFHPFDIFPVFTFPSSLVAGSTQLIAVGLDTGSGWTRYRTTEPFMPGETLKMVLRETPAAAPAGHPRVQEGRIAEAPPAIARYQVPILAGTTLALLLAALVVARSAKERETASNRH